jgi:hypothetical protein
MRSTTSSLTRQVSTPNLKGEDSKAERVSSQRSNSFSRSIKKASTPQSSQQAKSDLNFSGVSSITSQTPKVRTKQQLVLKPPPKPPAINANRVRKSIAFDAGSRVVMKGPLKSSLGLQASTADCKDQESREDIAKARLIMSLFLKEEEERFKRKAQEKVQADVKFLFAVGQELSKDIQNMREEKDKMKSMMCSTKILSVYKNKLIQLLQIKQKLELKMREINCEIERKYSQILFTDQPDDALSVCLQLKSKLKEASSKQQEGKLKDFVAAVDSSLHLVRLQQEIKSMVKESEEYSERLQKSIRLFEKYMKCLERYQSN